MKFGEIKTIIENNLVDSVKDKKVFKENIQNFKKHFLNDSKLSKLYLIYGDLSKPRGLNEEEANRYLNEGVNWARTLIKEAKIPLIKNNLNKNDYELIDALVYETSKTVDESLDVKTKALSVLQTKPKEDINRINIPISSMIKVSNEKIKEHLNSMDESSKAEIISLLSENKEDLKSNFTLLKEDTITKLENIKNSEKDLNLGKKLEETIDKVSNEKFDILNYYMLKKLNQSLI
jgi:hypothetical protein